MSYGENMTVVRVMPTSVNSMLAGTFAVVIPPSVSADNGSNNEDDGASAPETNAPETNAPETDAPETEASITETVVEKDGGCGSAIGITSMALVAVGVCATVAFNKKRED